MIIVGVELLSYVPLNIERLFEFDFENIVYMETVDSVPIMKK